MVDNNFQPMDFGEVFANTFTVIRRTFSAGIIVLLLLVAAVMIYSWGYTNFLGEMSTVFLKFGNINIEKDQKAAQELGQQMSAVVWPYLGSLLAAFVLFLFGQTIATVASWEGVNGHPIDLGGLLKRSFGKLLLFNLIQWLALAVVMVMVALLMYILTFALVGKAAGSIIALMISSLVVFLPTMFRVQEMDVDERGPFRGLTSAVSLLWTSAWRAVGPVLVLIIADVAILTLVSVLLTGTPPAVGMGGGSGTDPQAAAAALARVRAMMTPGVFAATVAIHSLVLLFLFNLITVVYTDLRIRRGDYVRSEELEAWEQNI
ncbi:MAG: hypothetical protein ABIR47_02315 [Candidatus Kapaibacterium sp.]